MNLVESIPELQSALLGGLRGVGYAEVFSSPGKQDECRGVIVFDDGVDVAALSSDEVVFEGIVYREGAENIETFPVNVLLVNSDQNREPGATFVAKAGLV